MIVLQYKSIDRGYEKLAAAIIYQAIMDYFEANTLRTSVRKHSSERYRDDAERWLKSEDARFLCECLEIDAKQLYKIISSVSDEDKEGLRRCGQKKLLEYFSSRSCLRQSDEESGD